MAQHVIAQRFDDLDGSPAVETVRFGYAGREHEIDEIKLSEEHPARAKSDHDRLGLSALAREPRD